MKYILDTDTFTHLQKDNENVKRRLKNLNNEVGTSIITKAEVLNGRYAFLLKADNSENLKKAQRLLYESENWLSKLSTIEFESKSFAIFDEFRQNSKFRKIGRADMLIASICLANRAVLVTRNVKHFKQFPNLNVENWVD